MAIGDVIVEQYCLAVSARDTVNEVLDSGDRESGGALEDALLTAARDECVFLLDPSADVSHDAFHPDRVDDLPTVNAPNLYFAVSHLEKHGYLRTHDVWTEGTGNSYLDQGRVITAYEVTRPFRLASVRYRYVYGGDYYYPASDRWFVDEVTPVISAGLYLAGYVGDYSLTLEGIAEIEPRDEESLFYDLVEVEGFMASRCDARCEACDAHWFAESGSWHFQPETRGAAPEWDYDDVEEFHDDDTVPCPSCASGRVGFLIY